MDQYTQTNRLISIETPLGEDKILLTTFSGSEHFSDLFEFHITGLSADLAIKPDSLIGKEVTVTIKGNTKKVFHGFINAFKVGEVKSHDMREYKMTMVPWLWFLSRTENRRIFQNKKTSEIVKVIFEDLGFKDFEFKLQGTQSVREYCVQYAESDLHFISRLLEEDGFAYYFKHTDKKHTLVIIDQTSSCEKCSDKALTYSRGTTPDNEINRWEHGYEFRTGAWTLNDYNFKEPSKNQLAETITQGKFANNKNYQHYEYPAVYDFPSGRDTVKRRMEAEEVEINTITGDSTCIDFFAGGLFKVDKHETKEERGDYLLTSVTHSAQDASYFAGESGSSFYKNEFRCIPADVPYRPALRHKKIRMFGPQSAIVTGPQGEEIYIDEYGRIKVQFIWDREGKKDENSSCYLRVMQSWAGNQWGASFIPRIGHEVIVTFLDGDPDRPIVTGTVYNGANKPVYSSKTQSGIKTRSTKGASAENFNELRFEDLKGSEQIFIHAEKNMDTEVENDETHTVDHDRTKTVKHDEIVTIDNDRTETVKHDEKITIDNDRTKTVHNNEKITIDRNRTESVGDNHTGKVGNTHSLTAGDKIEFVTGSSSIVMTSDGKITIKGVDIDVIGSGEINIKAAKNIVLKGKKILEN